MIRPEVSAGPSDRKRSPANVAEEILFVVSAGGVAARCAHDAGAKATLSENTVEAASIDWDSVDIGERDDALPLRTPGRMPPMARIGLWLAIFILAATLIGLAWSVLAAIFSRW